MSIKTKNSGFTLIELLVVVSVIGILSGITLGVLNSSGLRSKSRDSLRKTDLKKVQTALELYFADNRGYPKSVSWATISSVLNAPVVSGNYLDVLPVDPAANTGNDPCGGVPSAYLYKTDSPTCGGSPCSLGSKYILTARMEVSTSDDDSLCTSLKNWSSFGSCSPAATAYCYGVQNP